MKHLLSKIPAINKILMTEEVKQLLEEYPEVFVKDIVKKETENIKNGAVNCKIVANETLLNSIVLKYVY
ncbi:MAG: hypothetical protein ACFNJI_07725 [Leptotrichia hongkongensis]